MKPNPPQPVGPRWAQRLLTWLHPPETLEEVEGDLAELYAYWCDRAGKTQATLRYVLNVVSVVPPFVRRRQQKQEYYQPSLFSFDMLRNYLKIAWRNLLRNKAFSAINIVGLAIGLACCLLISLFVTDELSYDRFHTNADRIYRVVLRGTLNGEQIREANIMPPVAPTLRATFPEVQETTRLHVGEPTRFSYQDKAFEEKGFIFADSTFFRVFSFPLIKGDEKTALSRPNTVVITSAIAQKYFGDEDPIGKVLAIKKRQTTYTVTGVLADVPQNSHVHFDLLGSMATLSEANQTNWLQSNFFTYVLLPDDFDYRQLETKLRPVVVMNMLPPFAKAMGVSQAELSRKGTALNLYLQPLTDIHLRSDLKPNTELEPGGDIRYIYLFGSIALFMLLLACINFMNLSTAGAAKRAKEVGIRKVLGSERSKLVGQFLSESALFTFLSLLLALGLVLIGLPLFNALSGKALNLSPLKTPYVLPTLIGFGLVVSLIAGSYPAFYLSSFRPIAILKGLRIGSGRLGLRSGLVVFQFLVSISLIIATTVVYQQLRYSQNIKLGYDKDQVVVLEGTGALGNNETVFRQQLAQDSRVVNASISGFLPNDRYNTGLIAMQPDRMDAQMTRMTYFGVDNQYIPTLGIKLVAGRNFSVNFRSDSSGVVINETAARQFGWTNPLEHTLTNPALPQNGNMARTFRVIGVVKDFHFRSLHERIAPMVMLLTGNAGSIIVKAKADDTAGLLASLQAQWAAFKTDEPFRYSFLDESYQATYQAELKAGRILALFAGLTIFIACLGLFGLATFTAEQRTKEIGVRKVLGASVTSIVALLSKDFLKLVLIAIVIASPIAWYAMNRWLQDFAYKITIEWWVFALAGLLAVGIALLTVSFQSIKASLMNPVKSLRSE